ncbi:MAG: amidase [Rhodospirillaceae bacterium]|jgi:aspartyl-tRNA(Asn)/glutamyl-tRNA(Gln) amidotransferase subunit A|nr:amidase [Rhodospirillaceae bacterium]MBT5895432.1 amidase [Rhodospirillaceae bacterium]MBT6431273.1 amidase [Rhodospirillaceae bacterium]
MTDLHWLSIDEVGARLRRGDIGAVELTQAMLDRIGALDGKLNAYITVTAELALAQADVAEKELHAGEDRGPLHGIPIALKDLLATQGIPTTFASRAYADDIPDFDATVATRLADAGAVLLGKTNLSEGAANSSSQSSAFGGPCNPWNTDYITGGSSGGSAAAVAAGLAYAAIGSDTAMSIRQPAALCGIVGLKPTFGRVSKHGAMVLSNSLDHLGPMTRGVADAAVILQVLAGHDPADPDSADLPVPEYSAARPSVLGTRLAIPREDFFANTDSEWAAATERAIELFQYHGASVEEIKLPDLELFSHAANLIIAVEAAAFHAQRFRDRPDDFGPTLRRVIEAGQSHDGVAYVKAQQIRQQVKAAIIAAFKGYDAMVLPTTALPACPIVEDDPALLRTRAHNTLPFNALGWPAISVPSGFSENGLPMGLQIVGQPFAEGKVLALAKVYEQATPWHKERPNI